MKKTALAFLVSVLLLTAACVPAPSPLTDDKLIDSARTAYAKIADQGNSDWITPQQQQMIAIEIAKLGVVVEGNHLENQNTQQVIDFVKMIQSGGSGAITVCQQRQHALSISRFVAKSGTVTLHQQSATLDDTSAPELYPPRPIGVFEIRDSYLIYAESEEAIDENSSGAGFRVEPLSADLIKLCDQYLDTLWNRSNVLNTRWSPEDTHELDWDWMFEALLVGKNNIYYEDSGYPLEADGYTYAVPADVVEQTLTAAFPVTVQQLRLLPAYHADRGVYLFIGFRGGGYASNFEVTAATENPDGSLTMTVSSSAVDFGHGAVPYSLLTVLPDGQGGCRYLSNKII